MSTASEPSSQRTGSPQGRRQFVTTLLTAAGIAPILFVPGRAVDAPARVPAKGLTVQQVIDLVLKSIPGAPFAQTVDTLKAGGKDQLVTGIVTTMFATNEIIEKAAALNANFIIAHEPTFYNHTDDTSWLENDPVYLHKKALLQQHGMAVWRCHDYIHAHQPDGVLMGVLTALGWDGYYNPQKPYLADIPPAGLQTIIDLVKKKLGIAHLRFIGNRQALCRRIMVLPGAAGGRRQIEAIRKEQPDVVLCGELNEWETSEYIRDLRHAGGKTSLLVLGHIVSEEPGLEWLLQWLQPQLPDTRITHIPSKDAFEWA